MEFEQWAAEACAVADRAVLYRFAIKQLAKDAVDQAVQEARKRHQQVSFRTRKHVINFICQRAEWRAIQEIRRLRRRRENQESEDAPLEERTGEEPQPDDLAIRNEDQIAVRECLAELPDNLRQILRFSYYDDLKDMEIAERLVEDRARDADRQRYWRRRQDALNLLRKCLLDRGVGPEEWP